MRLDKFTGALFKGSLPSPTAKFLASCLKAARANGAKRIVNPCAGTFGLAQVALSAGFAPQQLLTGDIGLVSSIIGQVALGRPVAELGIRYLDARLRPAADFTGTPIEAGAALAAIKLCQYKSNSYYVSLLAQDIDAGWERVATALQAQVDAKAAALRGFAFERADIWAQIEATADDPEAVLCLFPPAYKNGYERMFPITDRIAWDEPRVAQFDPNLQTRLTDRLRDARALAVWATYGELAEGDSGRAVFSEWKPGREVAHWWLANRPDGLPKGVHKRKQTVLEPAGYPLWPFNKAITADVTVRFVETKSSVALYYRDLFAHKLGVTRAERYFLVLVDGCLMSVFGMFFSEVERGQSETVYETFGFTVPNGVHGRISRLFMLLLVSGDAQRTFQAMIRSPLRRVSGLQTTCIAPHPEVKTDRGILKLRQRTTLPDGRFKLVYVADFNAYSFTDRINQWLRKDAAVPPRVLEAHDGAGNRSPA